MRVLSLRLPYKTALQIVYRDLGFRTAPLLVVLSVSYRFEDALFTLRPRVHSRNEYHSRFSLSLSVSMHSCRERENKHVIIKNIGMEYGAILFLSSGGYPNILMLT